LDTVEVDLVEVKVYAYFDVIEISGDLDPYAVLLGNN
jgi:hypothetical protein